MISPQPTLPADPFPFVPATYEVNQLKSIDPGYRDYIPADQIRRMGRIIRMGIAAARICLKDANIRNQPAGDDLIKPDAIITGTGLGCMEDTGKFLASMIRNREEFLTPTSFIQSTHNTVAGQIALLLQCNGYNFTYVHRAISFESALTDAAMQVETGQADTVLAGGADEITADYAGITNRFGMWKPNPISNLDLYNDRRRGSIAGEGAAFFLLSDKKSDRSYAAIAGTATSLGHDSDALTQAWIRRFLEYHTLEPGDIDLVIVGMNGDPRNDRHYYDAIEKIFPSCAVGRYKHLCGEYFTAAAFATWMSARILQSQLIPDTVVAGKNPTRLKHILIYNHFHAINHGLILLTAV